jgi:hypothetical protein
LKEIVISKDKAVFRLDRNGRWHNAAGPFEHKKIIDYFHASIRRDEGGFHLFQERGDCREKVYFSYEDTALFVFEVAFDTEAVALTLNTGQRIELAPESLFVRNDQLYTRLNEDPVKFTERCLIKLSQRLSLEDGRYFIRIGPDKHEIPEV